MILTVLNNANQNNILFLGMKKESLPKSSESLQQKIGQLEEAFKSACLAAGEPLSYCALVLRSLNRNRYSTKAVELRVKTYILIDEINSLKKHTSFSQNMSVLMAQREQIIRFLRSQLIVNRRARDINLKSCCDKVESIRMHTLTILENLQNLVGRFKVRRSEYVSDILQRLSQGTDFLRWTALRKHIEFSNTEDPLFIVPLRKFRNLELVSDYNRKPIINLFAIDEELKARLYNADKFLKRDEEDPGQSMELSPSVITQFDYDEIIYDDTRESGRLHLRPIKTIQKFLLPEIPTKKNMKPNGDSSDLSVMLRRIINESQVDHKSRLHKDNPFKVKRRAITQNNQYQTQTQKESSTTKNGQVRKNNLNHRRLKTIDFADDSHEGDKEDISKIVTIKKQKTPRKEVSSSSDKIGQLSSDVKLRQILLSRPSLSISQPKQKERLSGSNISDKIIAPFEIGRDESWEQQNRASRVSRLSHAEDRGAFQPVSKIQKSKKKRNNNIRITNQSVIEKQTIIEEQSHRKEEIPTQNSKVKWFSDKDNVRSKDFSPEVREKIEWVEKFSKISNSNMQEKKLKKQKIRFQKESELSDTGDKQLGIMYKNPIFEAQRERQRQQSNRQIKAKSKRSPIDLLKGMIKNSDINYRVIIKTKIEREEENQTGKQQHRKKVQTQNKEESNSSHKRQIEADNDKKLKENVQKRLEITQNQGYQVFPQNTKVYQENPQNVLPVPQSQIYQINPQNTQEIPQTQVYQSSINPNNQSSIINPSPKQLQQSSPLLYPNSVPLKSKPKPSVPQLSFEAIRPTGSSGPSSPHSYQQMNQFLNSVNNSKLPQPLNSNIEDNHREDIATESKLKRERALIIQKCIFVSKSMEQSVLLSQIKQFNKQSLKHVEPYITTNYFKNRQIMMTSCVFKEEIACYSLHYPYITKNSRFLFILHLQIREKYSVIGQQLISTFFKYFFCNDPANKIIFLKHKQLFSEEFGQILQTQPFYAGQISTPIKGSQLSEKSFLFERKELKCSKDLEYSNIFSSYFLYITHSNEPIVTAPKTKKTYFSSNFLKKVQSSLKKKEVKSFLNYAQLSTYLQQQKLPEFTKCKSDNEILLYSQFFEDCLINSRYYVFSKYFYFTIQPPYSYLYEGDDVYYILLSTSVQRKYIILADKIFQQTEGIDLYQNFRTNILNKKINEIFTQSNKRGTLVACPQFRKSAEIEFANTNGVGMINFSLNWKEYIKGVRYFPEEQVKIQLIGPFFCGLVELDESNAITQIYSAIIEETDLQI